MSERQVMPISQRDHFEEQVRRVAPGYSATLNGISHPLRVLDIVKNSPTGPKPDAAAGLKFDGSA